MKEIFFHQIFIDSRYQNYLNFCWQAELLHLIPGRSFNFRSFDLKKNGPGSKYLLLQNY